MPVTAVATTGAAAAAEPDADGHGDGAAEADAGALAVEAGALAAAAGALADAAGALAGALALAAGAGALASALALALLLALALAAAESQEPRADCWIVVALPPETARMIPRVRPSAIGMARGTAIRAARLFPRRRGADRCPLSIQSTSMWKSPVTLPVHHRRPGLSARSANQKDSRRVSLF
jgi:hypothetical protein